MIKKFFALFLIFMMTSAYANHPVNNLMQLESAFNNFNFALNVEWDQKDKKFYNSQLNTLTNVIKNLQTKGLNQEELIEFAKRNILDKKLAKDLDQMLQHVKTSKMTSSETRKFVMEYMGKNHSEGASWIGKKSSFWVILGIILIVAIIIAAVDDHDSDNHNSCNDEYVCYDYYDTFNYFTYQDCFWESYCY